MAREKDDETRPWKTADPWISGILAYLIPGAGHLYQGRRFKAALYAVCILGTFFYGTLLAEWKAVQAPAQGRSRPGYLAQMATGLPALTALVQSRRYTGQLEAIDFERLEDGRGFVETLESSIDAPFRGEMVVVDESDQQEFRAVTGRLRLEPTLDDLGGPRVEGSLRFDDPGDGPPEVTLGGRVKIRPAIYGSSERQLACDVVDGDGEIVGQILGVVPRSFLNWYQVPLDPAEEQLLHQRLGKRLELALVYTWVAGFLNVLAIWDCIAGPAYGIGDGSDEEEDAEDEAKKADEPSSAKKAKEKTEAAP